MTKLMCSEDCGERFTRIETKLDEIHAVLCDSMDGKTHGLHHRINDLEEKMEEKMDKSVSNGLTHRVHTLEEKVSDGNADRKWWHQTMSTAVVMLLTGLLASGITYAAAQTMGRTVTAQSNVQVNDWADMTDHPQE